MVDTDGNGTNVERFLMASVTPRITVDPESRKVSLYFETTANVEAGVQGVDVTIPLSVPQTLHLLSGLLDALQLIEPLESS